MKCNICNETIAVESQTGWEYGHNAQPVKDGRCCHSCNNNVVIPHRLIQASPPPKGHRIVH